MSNEFTTKAGQKYAVKQSSSMDVLNIVLGYKLVTEEEMRNIRLAELGTTVITGVVNFFVKRSDRKAEAKREAERAERAAQRKVEREAREAKFAADQATRKAEWAQQAFEREANHEAHLRRMRDIQDRGPWGNDFPAATPPTTYRSAPRTVTSINDSTGKESA